jgi:hypothetical protein
MPPPPAPPTPNTSADPRAIQPGDVADANPRIISNLIVDQTANNPAVIYKALSDAGVVADPFAAMGEVATAVERIKTEKAAIAPLQAAVTAAEASVAAAQAGITPSLQATIDAYTTANTALTALTASAAAAAGATTQVRNALNTGGAVAGAIDTGAYNFAQVVIGQLVADADSRAGPERQGSGRARARRTPDRRHQDEARSRPGQDRPAVAPPAARR